MGVLLIAHLVSDGGPRVRRDVVATARGLPYDAGVRRACLLLGFAGCSFSATVAPEDAGGDGGPDTPDTSVPGRVIDGLIALWNFDETSGNRIAETSMAGTAIDFTIGDPSKITWTDGGIRIDSPVLINSGFTRNRLVDASVASNELTLEAWVTPANDTQTGTVTAQPARIVSFAPSNGSNHHASLGQDAGTWMAQARTSASGVDAHGSPGLTEPLVATATHVVLTVDMTGRRLYINGDLAMQDALGGAFGWDPNRTVSLSGEPNGQNPWLGSIFLIAMYDRVLTEQEVLTNFLAGP